MPQSLSAGRFRTPLRPWARGLIGLTAALLLSKATPQAVDAARTSQRQDVQLAVYVMKSDGTEAKKLVQVPNYRWHGSPTWSHDGKKLAFDCYPGSWTNWDGHIFVVGADGKEPNDLGPGAVPSWSPDDKQIVFFIPERNPMGIKPGIWVMNADGTGREWLCEGNWPAWSPDGSKVAYSSNHAGFPSLYLLDTVEGTKTRLVEQGYDMVLGPSWAPDGKRLTFVAAKDGVQEINIVSTDGSAKGVRTRAKGMVGHRPAWSPDGSRIMFWIEDGVRRFHVVDPDSEDPAVVLKEQDAGGFISDQAWSPDATKVAFVSDRG